MSSHDNHQSATTVAQKPDTKAIWVTFWILLGVTAVEFLIAFTTDSKPFRLVTFILLTFVKAYYIVGNFMHLRHEVKALIWSVVFPIAFIVWLVAALIYEGGSILGSH
ncbi:MAG TPA: cytochrome C oxidase subunit IV family protein [Catalimonadaceae bacterium]|nr:cytochrome C oxidase subunit IV family protein [Catalimonadaceae bacterium]HPI11447.1 cytochrome C oxidase subunit IV family protein [Catalimonadaceae bacterium]